MQKFISSCFLNPEGSTQQKALHVRGPPLTRDLAQDQRKKKQIFEIDPKHTDCSAISIKEKKNAATHNM